MEAAAALRLHHLSIALALFVFLFSSFFCLSHSLSLKLLASLWPCESVSAGISKIFFSLYTEMEKRQHFSAAWLHLSYLLSSQKRKKWEEGEKLC